MQRSIARLFHSQHRTPIIPQAPVAGCEAPLSVAYLLTRSPVVKPEPHPLELEMSFTLSREQQRYARHDAESATHFMANRQQSMDSWNRTDAAQIVSNYFGMDIYQDALKTVLQRYKPQPRVTRHDIVNPLSSEMTGDVPPPRHTLQRRLDDHLFLIVQDNASGKWTVPSAERAPHETLRMTVDRAIHEHHGGALDTYVWSNAPQAVTTSDDRKTFIFNAVYLAGRPVLAGFKDHAWVTRDELRHYDGHFAHPALLDVLRDIAPDAYFETA